MYNRSDRMILKHHNNQKVSNQILAYILYLHFLYNIITVRENYSIVASTLKIV